MTVFHSSLLFAVLKSENSQNGHSFCRLFALSCPDCWTHTIQPQQVAFQLLTRFRHSLLNCVSKSLWNSFRLRVSRNSLNEFHLASNLDSKLDSKFWEQSKLRAFEVSQRWVQLVCNQGGKNSKMPDISDIVEHRPNKPEIATRLFSAIASAGYF